MNPVTPQDVSPHDVSPHDVSPHDLRYARWMQRGALLGFVLLLLSYALYLGGVLKPAVDLQRLPQLWTLPVADYLRASGSQDGWYWLSQWHQGDYLNVLGTPRSRRSVILPCCLVCGALVNRRWPGSRSLSCWCCCVLLRVYWVLERPERN